MRVIYFLIAIACIVVAIGLSSGELQQYVKFNSVKSEIVLFIMSLTCGLLFLNFSINESKN
jgi:hypothetical protein